MHARTRGRILQASLQERLSRTAVHADLCSSTAQHNSWVHGDSVQGVGRLGWQLQSIERSSGLQYQLTYKTAQGQRKVQARSVILTLPAYAAADVLQVSPGNGCCPALPLGLGFRA